jgi:hypothetical protein
MFCEGQMGAVFYRGSIAGDWRGSLPCPDALVRRVLGGAPDSQCS